MQKECNIVILATDKPSQLAIEKGSKTLFYFSKDIRVLNSQHLYITSDDEIKEGDWYYSNKVVKGNPLTQYFEKEHFNTDKGPCISLANQNAKKIIATTDQSLVIAGTEKWIYPQKLPKPSQQFIELFIKQYNAGNPITKVMVEYRHLGGTGSGYVSKLNPDNTINIKTTKDSWSRDEVAKAIHDCMILANSIEIGRLQSFVDKWIEQNL